MSLSSAIVRRLRRPEAALVALALGCSAYFYQAGGWNQNARFDLVRAIVERGTLSIDAYEGNTGDKARVGGRTYSDKAPGISLLALPVHAAAVALRPDLRETDRFQAVSSYACTVWAVALPSALAVAALFRLLAWMGVPAAMAGLTTVAYALGTLAFPYSTLMYGHQTSAALLLLAFVLLARDRLRPPPRPARAGPLLAGALCGLAITVEYTAALGAAVLVAYAMGRPWSRIVWLLAGLAAGVLPALVYHTLAFGGPFTLAYSFSIQQPRHRGLFMGLGPPSGRALYYLLVHEYRGLFHGSPWLLLAVPGLAAWWRQESLRRTLAVCAAIPLLYLALNASLTDWHGGWGMGPRHLVPALPFLSVCSAGLWPRAGSGAPALRGSLRRAAVAAFVAAASVSILLMLAGTAVKPEVPRAVERPFQGFLLPSFLDGDLAVNTQSIDMVTGRGRTQPHAWNLGQRAGLRGHASLVPLGLFALAAGAWLAGALRQAPERVR